MTKNVIISVLAKAVDDTILKEWHHSGRIEIEHSDDFVFTASGKQYRVLLEEVRN